MYVIHKKYKIHAPSKTVWRVLTEVDLIERWTGSLVRMSEKEGEEFSLWNGDIWGRNIEVVPETRLVQQWYAGNWKKPSIVTFTLSENDGVTTLELQHIDIPEKEKIGVEKGWDEYYLSQVKNLAEFLS